MNKRSKDLRQIVSETVDFAKRNGRKERSLHGEGWTGNDEIVPSRQASRSVFKAKRAEDLPGEIRTYYNLPLIKKAHWGWEIYLYFYLGGIAGGSYLVSTLMDLFGVRKAGPVIRMGRYLSFVCIVLSPILLIMDLGRPLRFHHMLSILKFRSAMSLGTWGLSTFGMLCGFTAAHQMAQDGLLAWFPLSGRLMRALPVKVIEGVGAVFGLFVASYTGVLLSSTAVPI